MKRAFRPSLFRAVLLGGLLSASPAFAHIDLLAPEARSHGTAASGDTAVDMNTNQKTTPCGQVTNGRGNRVTTYAPGQVVTIQVREETPHDSYIRVAIDLDGDTFPQRPTMSTPAETAAVAEAAEEALFGADADNLLAVVRENNNTANFVHEIPVTLPNETCTNCTLQVIQFMYGANGPFYFQCADIVIAEGGADAGAGAGGSANAGSAGAGGRSAGAGGAAGSSTTGTAGRAGSASSGTAGSAMTGSAGSSGSGDDDDDEPAEDDGGCALPSAPGGSGSTAMFGLLALALGLLRRRR